MDYVEAQYAIADYWADVDATYGLDPDATGATPTQDLDSPTTTADWTFQSWSYPDCNANSDKDDGVALWDSESRVTFNAATSSVQTGRDELVQVRGPRGTCSGVLITDTYVLTAAHCVTMGDGSEFAGTMLQVCSDGGSSNCFPVGRAIPAPGWTGTTSASTTNDISDDYALVKITGLTRPTDPVMVLSTDARDDIKKRHPEREGFDSPLINGAGACVAVATSQGVEHPSTPVRGTRGGLVRLRADSSPGASGGAYFFEAGGVGRIVGVHSGIMPGLAGTGHAGGPRVTEFRNWAISIFGNRFP